MQENDDDEIQVPTLVNDNASALACYSIMLSALKLKTNHLLRCKNLAGYQDFGVLLPRNFKDGTQHFTLQIVTRL